MTKRRIAVLGGGAAAMSAVFEITDRAEWDDHFEIDVYQLGWRLGGKGASGRNVSGPPRDPPDRHLARCFLDPGMVVTRQLHRGRWIPRTVLFPTNDEVGDQGLLGRLLSNLLDRVRGFRDEILMSGMQAARAIAGYPETVFGERDLDELDD